MSLVASGVTVKFGGVTALDNVDITLNRGEVLAVIGPNGSGKTTLFNAITGLIRPTAGAITVDDKDVGALAPHRRFSLGLTRTFQTPRFDPHMTVEDTILCGFYSRANPNLWGCLLPFASRSQRQWSRAMRAECSDIMDRLRLADYASRPIGELPIGHVRMVELGRALAAKPNFLMLDEPAAGLARREHAALCEQIIKLASQGVGVLLVEHNFSLIKSLASRAVVLLRGQVMLRGTPDAVSRDPGFMAAYLGSSAR